MLNNMSIGQYYQGNSILHKLDPRLKCIMFLIYVITVLMMDKAITISALVIVIVALIIIGRIPLKAVWQSMKPILPVAIMILILNILTLNEGNVIFEFWKIKITDTGLMNAFLIAFRLIMLIITSSLILTLTTTPLKIADALEKLFGPLKKIKVPVHEMSMMMSIALRFIPTLADETDKIMRAQTSRGATYDTGSFIGRLKGYVTVLIPLFISSFRRADELAIAMEARCYNGGEGRTKLNPLKITKTDVIVFAIFTAIAGALILLQILL